MTVTMSYSSGSQTPTPTLTKDLSNNQVTLTETSAQTGKAGSSEIFTLTLSDSRYPSVTQSVQGTFVYKAACTLNDLATMTVTGSDGNAIADYSYYAFTEGEKAFSYATANTPTCSGYIADESSI